MILWHQDGLTVLGANLLGAVMVTVAFACLWIEGRT